MSGCKILRNPCMGMKTVLVLEKITHGKSVSGEGGDVRGGEVV